jgi:hypothetical protein
MLAIIFLIGSAAFGTSLVRRVLVGVVDLWEQISWGIVCGWMISAIVTYALTRAYGSLTWGIVAITTVTIWVGFCVLAVGSEPVLSRKSWRTSLSVRGMTAGHKGLAAVLLIFAPVLWLLFSSHTFARGPDGVYSGGSAWFDLSFHAALASSFLYGDNFPPAYTPFAGEALRYPFMPDFHAAALMAAGMSMRTAFLATAFPLVMALIAIFYKFALRITISARAAALAVGLFLLNGGLGFIDLFSDWRGSGAGVIDFWNALPRNYANDAAHGIHWTNLITDTLLPQRAAVYGLSAGLIVLTLFAMLWEDNGFGASRRKLLLAAGVLTGILPLFHTHSYIAVEFISVLLFALRPRWDWLWFFVPALVLALPMLLSLMARAGTGDIIRLQPGWLGSDSPSFAVYMLRNFGLPLVLAFPAWIMAPRVWKLFYIPFLLLLMFAITVVVSPNVFDNGKLTYYWHAVNAVLIARWLVSIASIERLKWLTAPAAVVLALFSIATGIAAIKFESGRHELLFSWDEITAAEFVREHTPKNARFLTAPTFNHPVLTLAGRSVVRGPTDWLWAHGYEFRAREWDVRRIYAGGAEAVDLLRYYGVDYAFVGEGERREFAADEEFFDKHFSVICRAGDVTIYQVTPVAEMDSRHDGLPTRELATRVGDDPFAMLEEFPRIGYVVHRLLNAKAGRAPERDEFISAMKMFGRGLYVGAPAWERRLDENRRTFVMQLAGGDKSADELLRRLNTPDPDPLDYDKTYLRVHFFAYLGREPDEAGFNFWLPILARDHDYRSLSRAFMESEEYKKRAANWKVAADQSNSR